MLLCAHEQAYDDADVVPLGIYRSNYNLLVRYMTNDNGRLIIP